MMGLFEHWPYVNFHELNLDWVINRLKYVETAEKNAQESADKAEEYYEMMVDYIPPTRLYDNVLSMVNDTNLEAGYKTITLGYYLENDGGGAVYQIREKTELDTVSETADGSTTVGGLVLLENGLVAELMCDEYNVKQFGAKTGSYGTNPSYAQKAFEAVAGSIYKLAQDQADEFSSGIATVYVPIGSYFIHDINIPCGTKIYGDGYQSKIFHNYSSLNDLGYAIRIVGNSTIPATHIENITFKGGWSAVSHIPHFKAALYIEQRTEVHLKSVWFGSAVGCYSETSYGIYFTSCTFDICNTGLIVMNGALTQLSQCFFYGNTQYSLTGRNTKSLWLTDCSFGNCSGGVKFDSCRQIKINNVEFTDKSDISTDGAERNPLFSNIELNACNDITIANCTFNRRAGATISVNSCTDLYMSDLVLDTVSGYSSDNLKGITCIGTNENIDLLDIEINNSTATAPYVFSNILNNARLVRCKAKGTVPQTEPTVNGGVFCFDAVLSNAEMQDCLIDNVTAYCAIGLTKQTTLKAVNCVIDGTFTSKLKTYNNGKIKWSSNEIIKHIENVGASNSFVRMYYSNNVVSINGYVRGLEAGSGGFASILTLPDDIPAPTEEVNYAVAILYATATAGQGRLSSAGVMDVNIPGGWDANTSLWFSLSYMVN